MLREILNNLHYSFYQGFDDWREAIKVSYLPLLRDNIITHNYVDSVIKCVEEYGPYIVILDGVVMPHSSIHNKECNKTSIAFMSLKDPVKFEEGKEGKIFFSLSASDENQHIKNIERLMEILENEELLGELLNLECEEEFKNIVDKYE